MSIPILTIDNDISDEADGEFLDDNNYVMNRDIDDNSDSHNEEEDEEETGIKQGQQQWQRIHRLWYCRWQW